MSLESHNPTALWLSRWRLSLDSLSNNSQYQHSNLKLFWDLRGVRVVLCVKSESITGRNAAIIISDVKTQHRNVDYLIDLVKG